MQEQSPIRSTPHAGDDLIAIARAYVEYAVRQEREKREALLA